MQQLFSASSFGKNLETAGKLGDIAGTAWQTADPNSFANNGGQFLGAGSGAAHGLGGVFNPAKAEEDGDILQQLFYGPYLQQLFSASSFGKNLETAGKLGDIAGTAWQTADPNSFANNGGQFLGAGSGVAHGLGGVFNPAKAEEAGDILQQLQIII